MFLRSSWDGGGETGRASSYPVTEQAQFAQALTGGADLPTIGPWKALKSNDTYLILSFLSIRDLERGGRTSEMRNAG